jgi:hypothetical protein
MTKDPAIGFTRRPIMRALRNLPDVPGNRAECFRAAGFGQRRDYLSEQQWGKGAGGD